jgi:hypothetical protein
VVAVLFTILILKLPRRHVRVAVATIMGFMMMYYGLLPAALALAARPSLAKTPTKFDNRQICLQRHAYSCGPAAAVTCLKRLGIDAEEGTLAVESRCAPLLGTDGWLLADAITRRYGAAGGFTCAYRYVERLEDLPVPSVVDVLLPYTGGHYVAVLAIETDRVHIGDPLGGQQWLEPGHFLRQWRHGAVVFQRLNK